MLRKIEVFLSLFLLFSIMIYAGKSYELNTILMRSTFKLSGKYKSGTCFILGKPMKEETGKAYYVLITAAHVLESIEENMAILNLRTRKNNRYEKLPIVILIRKNGTPLWVKHPSADIAAMYVTLPKEADIHLISTNFIASDKKLKKFEIHPGDELFCLGFPLGAEANKAGFPILRSGKIASYPIIPTKETKRVLFDFEVFEGNSGGPVYFVESNRNYKSEIHIGTIRFIFGLVSQQKYMEEKISSLREIRKEKYPLGLAVVIHASLIKETLNMLPLLEKVNSED